MSFDILNKTLIWLFFLCLPATAIKLGGIAYLRPWLMIAIPMSLILAINILINQKIKIKIDYGIVSIFIFLLLCFWNAIYFNNEKSLNYFFAYFVVIFVSIFIIMGFLNKPILIRFALEANSKAVLFISIYSIIDITLLHFDMPSPASIFHLFDRGNAVSTFTSSPFISNDFYFFRAYALNEEPSVFSFYLMSLGFLGLWWRSKKILNYSFYLYTLFFSMALIATFSSSALFALLSSLITVSLIIGLPSFLKFLVSFRLKKRPYLLISIFVGFCLYFLSKSKMLSKMINPTSSRSGNIRLERLEIGLENATNSGFFGNGIGWTTLESGIGGSYNNWYLDLASDLGWIGLFLVLVYFSSILLLVLKNYKFFGLIPLLSVFSCLYFFMVFGQFFEPFAFISFSLITLLSKNKSYFT